MQHPSIRIGDAVVGPGCPTYVVAELSGNHNGSYQRALELVRAAKAAGADAVKLQTYTADTMTLPSDDSLFRIPEGGLWGGRTLYDLYQEAHTPWEWQRGLMAEARALGIELFSAPFDATAVDFLEELGVRAYKIASFEIVDHALIERVARTGKPLIISTGMSTADEIAEAVDVARAAGAREIVLLRCTSEYPAAPSSMDLATIPDMTRRFGYLVGLSDHTLSTTVPVVAVTLGACLVEKHLTLRRADGGPDAAFSLEPAELADMVAQIRFVERTLGAVRYGPTPGERENMVFRRSLFVVEPVRAGDTFTERNVRSIRPGNGLSPRHYREVLGRRATRDVSRGTPLSWELVER